VRKIKRGMGNEKKRRMEAKIKTGREIKIQWDEGKEKPIEKRRKERREDIYS
jgi:hypothetical protein